MKDNKEIYNQSINKERRKLLSLAGIASAGALLSPLLSKAAPSTIIEAGSNVDIASYIIFKDGNMIYAKNGTTGKIEFQGTDASAVIQGAINVLTNGGKIFIKAGLYDINSSIFLNPNKSLDSASITIEGEFNATILRQNSNINLFYTYYPNNVSNKTIKNLFLLGQAGTYTGMGIYCQKGKGWLIDNVTLASFGDRSIHLRYTDYSIINNVTIKDGSHRGIQLSANLTNPSNGNIISNCRIFNQTLSNWDTSTSSGDGIVLAEGVYNTRMSNCYVVGNAGYGFYIESGNPTIGPVNTNNVLISCVSSSNNQGIEVDYSNEVSIIGCSIKNNNTHGIRIQSGSNYIKILGCTIEDNSGYGISRKSGNTWIITNNLIKNNTLGQIQGYDSTSIIENNIGYITKNSSAATSVADGGIISHSLSSTPTKARLTGTVAGEFATITRLNTTSITVAIKKPDGSSGTPQTIYWEAEI